MGSFAKSLASVLFGWVSDVISRIWSLLTTDSGTDSIPWIGKQWILIVVILCVVGLVVDFLVYLYRWKPYKVWASFFHRKRTDETEQSDERQPVRLHTDETVTVHTVYENTVEQPDPEPQVHKAFDIEHSTATQKTEHPGNIPDGPSGAKDPYAPYRRPARTDSGIMQNIASDNADQWQPMPVHGAEGRTERHPYSQPVTRRRRIVQTLLGEDDTEEPVLARTNRPTPAVSSEEAYHEPVYPPQWKHNNRQSGETDFHDQRSVYKP